MVTLVRDEIKLEDSEAKAKLIEIPDGHGGTNRIGIIDLPSFYAPVDLPGNNGHATPKYTSVDVARLIKKLKQEHVSGIIVGSALQPRRLAGGSHQVHRPVHQGRPGRAGAQSRRPGDGGYRHRSRGSFMTARWW